MAKHDSFFYRVNKICALFLVIWVCWPWFCQNTGLVVGMFFAACWCMTAIFVHNKYPVSYDGLLMAFYVIYMALSFLRTGRIYENYKLYYYGSMVILFFVPYYMVRFYFARNEKEFMGKLAIVAVIFMIIGCITSISYTSIDENIMKTISQSMDTEFLEYRKAGIGSFGFIYMVMFSVIAVLGLSKTRSMIPSLATKLLLVFFCIIGAKCLIDSTFTTALLLLCVGAILVVITVKKPKSANVVVYLVVLAASILIVQIAGRILVSIEVDSLDVTTRLHEIGNLLMGEEGGVNTDSRWKLFLRSVRCFIKYPILGYNFALFPEISSGAHSEWMDILAIYGLTGGIPLIATVIIKLKNVRAMTRKLNYPYYGLLIFIFMVYGFVDPFLRLYHLGFAMFLLIPCIACISKTYEQKG